MQVNAVLPDEIRTRAVRVSAAVTTLCRTTGSVPMEYRPAVGLHIAVPDTETAPDPVQVIAGHEKPV